ncbi:recombination-associated protein RdgC [soil metagenome]
MWFKQVQFFQLQTPIPYNASKLTDQLQTFVFTPCLPSFPASYGWVSPVEEEDAPLVHAVNGNMMICLQFEEKILPTTVIRQELLKKIKLLELERGRRVPQKEKYVIKEELIQTLLPKAFTRISRTYAYIDTKNNWLVIDSISTAKVDKILDLLKKSLLAADIKLVTAKLAPTLTHWLVHENYPDVFSIEKSGVLMDPSNEGHVIRCQQQDLSANAIQLIIKEGCEVKQMALAWNELINFVLADDFTLRNIKYQDKVIDQANEMEPETLRKQFEVDFLIMAETLSQLLRELYDLFIPAEKTEPVAEITTAEALQ